MPDRLFSDPPPHPSLESGAATPALQRIARLAAAALRAPASAVSLHGAAPARVDEDARWSPAIAHASAVDAPATGVAGEVAWAAAPLTAGESGGALCVLDRAARAWSAEDLSLLADLAATAAAELESSVRRDAREARLRMLEKAVETMQLGVTVTDASGEIIYSNPAEARMHGYAPGALVGMPGSLLGAPRLRSGQVYDRFTAASRGTHESENVRGDGSTFPVKLWSDLVTDASGAVIARVTCCEDLTEVHAARAALVESEERYRSLVESVREVIVRSDERGRWTFLNPAWEEATGFPVAESLGLSFMHFVHPDDRQRVLDALAGLDAAGSAGLRLDARLRTAAGGSRWMELVVRPERAPDGRITGVVGVLADVTAHKEAARSLHTRGEDLERRVARRTAELAAANEELRVREELFRAVFEHAALGIGVAGVDGRILHANPALCRTVGRTAEELRGRHFAELLHRDDVADAMEEFGDLLAGEISGFRRDQRLLHPDGREVWASVSVTVVRGEDGGPQFTVALLEDVTAARAAEEARRASEARFHAVFTSTAAGIALLDVQGRPIDVNPALCEMLGYSEAELHQLSLAALAHPEDPDDGRALFRELLGGARGHHRIARRYLHRDGSVVWAQLTLSAVRDESGDPSYAIAIIHNDTERHRAREALLETEQRLLQAQKMEAVGRLAGGIAHDFNNLLMTTMTHTYLLLEETPPGDPRRRSVEQVQQVAERGAGLVRQLLAFSREQVLHPERLDLNEVVSDVEGLLRQYIGAAVQVEVAREPALAPVLADRTQLQQVLMNLAVNARDAMPEGGMLRVHTANLHVASEDAPGAVPAGSWVVLTVSDTGAGIDPALHSRIFEPFFTTKEAGRGTGLGLATVYGIVRQSGGFVRVRSETGQGAEFTVYLPAAGGGRVAPADMFPASEPAAELADATVLLVEDEDAVREPLCAVLRRAGYQVLEAANGHQALELAAAHPGPLHLVLTDVVMPRMGGRELARSLRAVRPGTPVLFMSGYSDELEGGEPALVEKPVTPPELLRRVAQAIGRGVRA